MEEMSRKYECITLINRERSYIVRCTLSEKGMKSEASLLYIDYKERIVNKEERKRSLFSLKSKYAENGDGNEGIVFSYHNMTLSFIKKDNNFFLTLVSPETELDDKRKGIKLNLTFSVNENKINLKNDESGIESISTLSLKEKTIWLGEEKDKSDVSSFFALREWKSVESSYTPKYSLFFFVERGLAYYVNNDLSLVIKEDNIYKEEPFKNEDFELYSDKTRIKGKQFYINKLAPSLFFKSRYEIISSLILIDENEEAEEGVGISYTNKKEGDDGK